MEIFQTVIYRVVEMSEKMNSEVSVKLLGNDAVEFLELKDKLGLKTNAALVRKLVKFYKVNSTAWSWITGSDRS